MDGAQAPLIPPYAQQRDNGAARDKVGDWDALMQRAIELGGLVVKAGIVEAETFRSRAGLG